MSVDQFILSSDTTDLNYPEIRPSLDLNFARTKTLDSRITFTRASGGSYVGADGLIKYAGVNEARFDHDPLTGESLGLFIEESRTNLVTDSIVLNNFPEKINVTVQDNAIISPDGTQNAGKIIETNDSGLHSLSRLNVSTTQNTTYTISGYFKKGERKIVFIAFRNVTFWGTPTGPSATFDVETGTLLSTSEVNVSTSIVNVGNGWYRCSVTATRDSVGTINSGITIRSVRDDNQNSYQGIEGYGFYAWGLQFEAGNFASSFIPTQGSTRTRATDNASITGKNFSEWYRQDEGTVFMDCTPIYDNSINQFRRMLSIHDNSGAQNNVIQILIEETSNLVISSVWNNSIPQSGFSLTNNSGNRFKVSFTVKRNNMNASYNGIIGPDDTSASLPSMTRMDIGSNIFSPFTTTGHYNKIAYYPKRLPNEQLRILTR